MGSSRDLATLAGRVGGRLETDAPDAGAIEVDDVSHDSRQTGPGTLFVAVRGEVHDGHEHVDGAVDAGSPAVCVDHEMGSAVPELVVENTRAALGPLSASVHDDPSHTLPVIGVTGTNGKTTVTHYIESIASASGIRVGLIGTIATRIAGEQVESSHTTPEASDFQRLLARMRDGGLELVACEVSSHALALSRVAATRFAVAAFTNLSHDHLDFHGDMDGYWSAKRSLFTDHDVDVSVVNIDDSAGARLVEDLPGDVLTVGGEGRLTIEGYEPAGSGTRVELSTPWGPIEGVAPVFGSFNVSNLAIAIGCCLISGIEIDDVKSAITNLEPVPGRFELVSGDDPIRVVVDYAHTPAGITHAIAAARSLTSDRVVAVVGAGGDRDRDKRPLMGAAASEADAVVITTDNPRSEEPARIAEDVRLGVPEGTPVVLELDRATAVERAVATGSDGDLVLVLGRGHEPYQEAKGSFVPLDDRDLARRALGRRRHSTDSNHDSGSMLP